VLICLKITRRKSFTIICVSFNNYLFLHQEHWGHHTPSIPNFFTVTGMSTKGPVVSLLNYIMTFTIIFYLKKKTQEFLS
jgi:hypothetical protein